MDNAQPVINEPLVRRLVAAQFPGWADQPIRPIVPGGWDNRTFRLGDDLVARLPSAACYAAQVEKEHRWLPVLAPSLPLAIPTPVGLGRPADGYPWPWSIYRWLDGEITSSAHVTNWNDVGVDLARFLVALRGIDTTGGPEPGAHNFHRGGSLTTYDTQVRQALAKLEGHINAAAVTPIWEAALATTWHDAPVWLHGDVSPANLLFSEGRLHALIDFGMLGVGDPACDLVIAWTMFQGESRDIFRAATNLDEGTWARGRAWALWKALIVAAKLTDTNAQESAAPWRVINEVLADTRR